MSAGWSGGSTRRWRRIRAEVLEENRVTNGGRCQLGVGGGVCAGQATQVHHTLGIRVTGHDKRYLIATCGACNRHVGDPMRNRVEPKRISKW